MPTEVRAFTPAQSFPDVPPGGGGGSEPIFYDVEFSDSDWQGNQPNVPPWLELLDFPAGAFKFVRGRIKGSFNVNTAATFNLVIGDRTNVNPSNNERVYLCSPFDLQNTAGTGRYQIWSSGNATTIDINVGVAFVVAMLPAAQNSFQLYSTSGVVVSNTSLRFLYNADDVTVPEFPAPGQTVDSRIKDVEARMHALEARLTQSRKNRARKS